MIRRWIDAGAPAPSAAEAAPTGEGRVPDVKPTVPVVGRGGGGGVRSRDAAHRGRRLQVRPPHVARRPEVDGRSTGMPTWSARWRSRQMGRGSRLPADRPAAFGEDQDLGRAADARKTSVDDSGPRRRDLASRSRRTASTIASASYDKLVKLWDVGHGEELRTLKEHSDAVYSVAFLPGGPQLVSGAGDRTLKIWDVATGKRLFTMSDALDARLRRRGASVRIADRGGRRRPDDPHLVVERDGAGAGRARCWRRRSRTATPCWAWPTRPTGRRSSRPAPIASIKVWDARDAARDERLLEPQPDWVHGARAERRWQVACGRAVRRHARPVFAGERRRGRTVRGAAMKK